MPDTAAPTRPPKLARVALPILLAVSVGTLTASLVLSPPKRKRAESPPPVETAPPVVVPMFTFTERSGRPVSNTDLLGKVWVASFVFTQCDQTCPLVTATMHKLQGDLDLTHRPDLRLVTFTMDPETDTPEVLRRYAADPVRPADPDHWLFLTGPADQVRGLMRNTFKLAFEQNRTPDTPGRKYSHGTFLFVVDKAGRVRGHFDGLQGAGDPTGERYRDSNARLAAAVTELLAEPAP